MPVVVINAFRFQQTIFNMAQAIAAGHSFFLPCSFRKRAGIQSSLRRQALITLGHRSAMCNYWKHDRVLQCQCATLVQPLLRTLG